MTDFVRVTKTRRRRGWEWEDTLVKRIKSSKSFEAFRLGGSSQVLPDILAVSNKSGELLVIEAKSGTTDQLVVKSDQINRSIKFTNTFRLYPKRHFILAFKFLKKKRLSANSYTNRKLKEYFKDFNLSIEKSEKVPDIICTYDGTTYIVVEGDKKKIDLPDYKMSFKK